MTVAYKGYAGFEHQAPLDSHALCFPYTTACAKVEGKVKYSHSPEKSMQCHAIDCMQLLHDTEFLKASSKAIQRQSSDD